MVCAVKRVFLQKQVRSKESRRRHAGQGPERAADTAGLLTQRGGRQGPLALSPGSLLALEFCDWDQEAVPDPPRAPAARKRAQAYRV